MTPRTTGRGFVISEMIIEEEEDVSESRQDGEEELTHKLLSICIDWFTKTSN